MKWTIEHKHEGMLVRDYLTSVRAFSRRMIKTVKFSDGIKVNGCSVTVRYNLRKGDLLEISFPEEQENSRLEPMEIPLNIVYEDQDVLVLDKQTGIPVMPSPHSNAGSIANGLVAHYQKQGEHYTAHIVTRLDRHTSGLMLVAKHRFSHSQLSFQQQQGNVKRAYTAIVQGFMENKKGEIHAPIGRKEGSIIEREVRSDGQEAITLYEVESEYDPGFSCVNVSLQTGRTHQIRVHFSWRGHPLLGDDLYGGPVNRINRQALHCHKLTFYQPFKQEWLHFTSGYPDDMKQLIPESN
ncbi:RluA family pseudouridine synthase [Virgibacillus sp. MSP4-1]|uniref:RluA family pseudouridine synthase n=1 Tax=Virgibacillus sp. MSP4-1 TaxID=2700081 RepID=UPI0003A93703|nr:RluA family pseudouridine synthase [Virgibacillus sp. MSP4-1]QHS21701.1 RluA family pseudouridine synthase [Virgibacillus sp. MSP4-1]